MAAPNDKYSAEGGLPRELPANYYHCFLGNGIDAVLIGYTGSMVADRARGLDRCYWYRSNAYYPEERLVLPVPNRYPSGQLPLPKIKDSPWAELAPLGHSWYEVYAQGRGPWAVLDFRQTFVPEEGTLYSEVDYGAARARVTTFLQIDAPLLLERYEFDRPVQLRAFMEPGVWSEEGYETEPFSRLELAEAQPQCGYRLGALKGHQKMLVEPAAQAGGRQGKRYWLDVEGQIILKYFSIQDNQWEEIQETLVDQARKEGFEHLHERHRRLWANYFAASRVEIPHPAFQKFYNFSRYQFKAMQNPKSGGLPVNNLRLTWSSHIFWDAYFVHRALLESNHLSEAMAACRFLQRTKGAARLHARRDFGAQGLKWDWELTHSGGRAYGTWTHQHEQVHNNAAYSNQIWHTYLFHRDLAFLKEYYPLLKGIATFFLDNVIEAQDGSYGTRPLVGVDERPERVRNEGYDLSGTIRILLNLILAEQVLGHRSKEALRAAALLPDLLQTLNSLYNGKFFRSAQGIDHLNMSSLAPLYPMELISPHDPRALSTALAYRERYAGRMVGHGGSEAGFPWSAGVLATVLARQGRADAAWRTVAETEPALCQHGGMSETVYPDGRWNMQYFGTAMGAVCTALHHFLLQVQGEHIYLFPALPSSWERGSFEHLRAAGVLISALWDRQHDRAEARVMNPLDRPLRRSIHWGDQVLDMALSPGEDRGLPTVRVSDLSIPRSEFFLGV
ncbi:MAG: hypothetical protein HYZ68_02225, partial [Chloroflexi bacterium]|nr:hypothetical protein [Chloroflexota bacterium]